MTINSVLLLRVSSVVDKDADVSVEELVTLSSKFYRRYIFRPGFALDHLRKHAGFYWHNPDVFWSLLGIRKVL